MATKTYLIESSEADYTAEEISFVHKHLLDEGIIADNDGAKGLLVKENSPTPDADVLIETGKALIEITKNSVTWKVALISDAQETVTVPSNSTGSVRVDAVIARVDTDTEPNLLKNNVGTIELVQGDGTSPLSDSDIDTALGDNDGWVRLADIYTPDSFSQITNSEITDRRTITKENPAVELALKKISTFKPFTVRAKDTPTQELEVSSGTVMFNDSNTVKFSGGTSPTFPDPSSNPRIDLLVLNSSGSLGRVAGSESASPSAPSYPTDKFVLAEVYNRVGQAKILNEDDGQNGYIKTNVDVFTIGSSVDFGSIYAVDSGSTNTYEIDVSSGPTGYNAGDLYLFEASSSNTGSATLNVDSNGAKTIKINDDNDLGGGEIENGELVLVGYDGTNFQLLSVEGVFREQVKAGETIDVTTAGNPLPVFQDQTDVNDEWKETKADNTSRMKFHGFALNDGTAGVDMLIKNGGIVSGFSGLNPGEKVYAQDGGGVGHTPGINYVLLGIALSSSEIMIKKGKMHSAHKGSAFLSFNNGNGEIKIDSFTTGFKPTKISISAAAQGDGIDAVKADGYWSENGVTYTSIEIDGNGGVNDISTRISYIFLNGGSWNTTIKIKNVTDTGFDVEYSRSGSGNASGVTVKISLFAEGEGV